MSAPALVAAAALGLNFAQRAVHEALLTSSGSRCRRASFLLTQVALAALIVEVAR